VSALRALRRWGRRRLARLDAAIDSLLPDRLFYGRMYRRAFGRRLDLRHPRTLNEKIIWLMLNYRRPLLTQLADKYLCREYVTARLGEAYVTHLHGVWDVPEAIDFDRLPETFVLKISNGFAMNIYCRDRATFDAAAARRTLASWLRRPHHVKFREWAYKDAPARIIAEELLVDAPYGAPIDYKVMCLNGEPRFIEVHTNRHVDHRRGAVDLSWTPLPFRINVHASRAHDAIPPPPKNLDELLASARRLAEGIPVLRVDLFSLEERRIRVGELTVYPAAGHLHFQPDSWDRYWGDRLELPAPWRA
jgi:hypothetical protein